MTTPHTPSLTDRLLSALELLIQGTEIIECRKCDGTGKRLAHPDEACHQCAGAGELVPQSYWPQFVKESRAVLAEARATSPVGAWVPVGERLPEQGCFVLAWAGTCHKAAFLNGEWMHMSGFEITSVTHWQPLPAGPDAQREDDCGVRGIIVYGEVRP